MQYMKLNFSIYLEHKRNWPKNRLAGGPEGAGFQVSEPLRRGPEWRHML
jgi:hypothetical protein